MKINTTFNVGDTAYVLENEECYRVEIRRINVIVKDGVDVEYGVTKFIPAGILKDFEHGAAYREEQLFLTKGEVKDKLKEIKKHREKKEELEGYMRNDLSTSNVFYASSIPKVSGGGLAGSCLNYKTI